MSEIKTILQKYIEGDATAAEKRQVLLWLSEDESHMEEYRTLRRLFNLQTWNLPGEHNQPACTRTRGLKRRQFAVNFLRLASIFLLGVLMTIFVDKTTTTDPQPQTVKVPSGQRTELLLSDGTQVWLNSGTSLLFPDNFNRKSRDVTLDDGEAYFRVTKDKTKPFVVHMENYNVRVLGTEFNVKFNKKNGYFETALLEGTVEVETNEGVTIDRLQKNEILSVTDGVINKTQVTDLYHYRWREGLICFENENVGSILSKIELYYDVQFDVRNLPLLDFKFTGKFRIRDGVEHVLKTLRLRYNFYYTINEDNNVILIE